jgi:DNA replication protein DnaC
MERLRKYVEQWEAMEADNQGLLLYGGCGTGKSFGAACITNALRAKGLPVYFNTTAGIVQDIQAMFGNEEELKAFKRDLQKYPLVVLDDFGVERQTEYVLETLYMVIDGRYRAGKPLIITTNLPLETIVNEKEADLSKRRIYDRVQEACAIRVDFGNAGRRQGIAKEKFTAGAKLLRK